MIQQTCGGSTDLLRTCPGLHRLVSLAPLPWDYHEACSTPPSEKNDFIAPGETRICKIFHFWGEMKKMKREKGT